MYEESQYAAHSIQAGAAACLHKQRAGTEIVTAVREILDNGTYVPDSFSSEPALASVPSRADAPHEYLSKHEFQSKE